jgi:hypothetical protein
VQAVFVLVVRTGNMSPYGSSSLRPAAAMFLSSGAVDRAKGSREEELEQKFNSRALQQVL